MEKEIRKEFVPDYTVKLDEFNTSPRPQPERLIATTDSSGTSWQCCPKCNATGEMYVVRNNNATNYFQGFETCDVCKGSKIISSITGLPPTL